jgi:hypothetical protein
MYRVEQYTIGSATGLQKRLNALLEAGHRIVAIVPMLGLPGKKDVLICTRLATKTEANVTPREFALEPAEIEKAHVWIQEHAKTCASKAVASSVSFVFSQTGVGEVIHVVCSCGEKCDLTDYDSF